MPTMTLSTRALVGLAGSAILVGVLAGCASGTTDATPTSTADAASGADLCATPSGDAVEGVTVTGELGSVPDVEFEAGLSVDATERTTVLEGDGAELAEGGTARVAYAVYNAATGEEVEAYGYAAGEEVTFTASATSILPGLARTIACQTEGSRVASVVPPAEGFGATGLESAGIGAEDSLVVVIDILEVVPTAAWGEPQPAPEGLPAVTLAEDGTPTVELPEGAAPTELQVGVLKKGDGAAVSEGASVTVQYQGVSWDTGEVFDQSWGSGPTTFSLDGLVPGFAQALVGQTVGSQVVAVIPPSLAYGEASDANTAPLAGQTLVFVIDILDAS